MLAVAAGSVENFKGFRLMPPTLEAAGDSGKRTLLGMGSAADPKMVTNAYFLSGS